MVTLRKPNDLLEVIEENKKANILGTSFPANHARTSTKPKMTLRECTVTGTKLVFWERSGNKEKNVRRDVVSNKSTGTFQIRIVSTCLSNVRCRHPLRIAYFVSENLDKEQHDTTGLYVVKVPEV